MRLFLALFLLLSTTFSFAKTKVEREYRLKEAEVPKQALMFIQSLSFDTSVKWFREEGFNKTSVEAKLKYKGQKYSIEFDSFGQFEDAEIKVKWKAVEQEVKANVEQYFSVNLSKANVQKVQIQYSGDKNEVIETLKQSAPTEKVLVRYELVVNVKKTNGDIEVREYLFSEQGEYLQHFIVVPTNSDNLEY